MLKQLGVLEVRKEDRVYQFVFTSPSQAGEIYDVLNEMRSFVIEKIMADQQASPPQEEKKDE